jgi:hypothetical protein
MSVVNKIRYVFRITHIDNIPYINEVGFVLQDSVYASPNYKSIGDSEVIEKRATMIKGYDLVQYIPFYFGPRSVMLYVIQHGYNGVKKQNPEDIVYCVIKIEELIANNVECLFTDGHALSVLTDFYTHDKLPEINGIISYDDVYAKYWVSEADTDLKRRKEAELLIKNALPANYICGYVVYNEQAKQRLIHYGVEVNRIVVNSEYYF